MPTCLPPAMILKTWFTFYLSVERREPTLTGGPRQGKVRLVLDQRTGKSQVVKV